MAKEVTPQTLLMIHGMGAPIHIHTQNQQRGRIFQMCLSSNGLFKLGAYNPLRYHRKICSYRGRILLLLF